jgi:hypothetical protein
MRSNRSAIYKLKLLADLAISSRDFRLRGGRGKLEHLFKAERTVLRYRGRP